MNKIQTKFVVSRQVFTPVLRQVARACASGKKADPIQTCVYLYAQKGRIKDGKQEPDFVTLVATDGILSIRSKVPAKVEIPGAIVIPGVRLVDVMTALPGSDEAVLEADGSFDVSAADQATRRNLVTVQAGANAKVEFAMQNPASFPAIFTSKSDEVILHEIQTEHLGTSLRMCKHAVIPDVNNAGHGVFCGKEPSYASAVSEPGAALMPMSWPVGLIPDGGVLLPLHAVETILTLCNTASRIHMGVKLHENGTAARVYLKDKTSEIAILLPLSEFPQALIGSLLDGIQGYMPMQDGAVPVQEPRMHVRMKRTELTNAVKLIQTISDSVALTARLASNQLHLHYQGSAGAADQFVAATCTLYASGQPPAAWADPVWTLQGTEGKTSETFGININMLAAHLGQLSQICEEVVFVISPNTIGPQYLLPVLTQNQDTLGYVGMQSAIEL